jgi:hypothetical protein
VSFSGRLDSTTVLTAKNCRAVVFSVDARPELDLPDFLDVLTIDKIEDWAEGRARPELEKMVREGVKGALDAAVDNLYAVNPRVGIVEVFTASRRVVMQLCSSLPLTTPPAGWFIARLRGTATITTNDPSLPGPIVTDVTMPLSFSEDRTLASIAGFPGIQFRSDSVTTTVTLTAGGEGPFDTAAGSMDLPATLHFAHDVPVGDSDAEFTFTTGRSTSPTGALSVAGAPLNRETKALTLVGTSTFNGGRLDGTDCALVIAGKLSELP